MSNRTEDESKDFADHLRSVQFSLVAICVALMVIATSPAPRELDNARQQILSILEMSREWPKDWIFKEAQNSASHQPTNDSTFTNQVISLSTLSAMEVKGQRFNVTVIGPTWFITTQKGPVYQRIDPALRSPWRPEWLSSYFPSNPVAESFLGPPVTLSDFRTIWDSLPNIDLELIGVRSNLELPRPGKRNIPWKPVNTSPEYKTLYLTCWVQDSCSVGDKDVGAFLIKTEIDTHIDLQLQNKLVAKYPTLLRLGTFGEVFPELDRITKDYQDLKLEKIETIVLSERNRAKEDFAAFGIKFPVENATRWGILILLGTQLYFWIHLREYKARQIITPSIAWIGAYEGITPRLIFSVSTLVFPVVVAYVIASRSDLPAPVWFPRAGSTCITGVSLLISSFTASSYFDVYPKVAKLKSSARQFLAGLKRKGLRGGDKVI